MKLLDELKQHIADKKIVVVVGTGISVGATGGASTASWIGLLENAIERCLDLGLVDDTKQDSLLLDVNSGELDRLLSAAEFVATKLGAPDGGEYADWLVKSVGSLRAVAPSVIEAIRDLGCPIATTNYDSLLEQVTGLPSVTWLDRAQMERVLRRDELGIAHLHGHFLKPESVVLGLRSYENVLRDEHAQASLRTLVMRDRLLFIGFGAGLADPNFGGLVKWMGRVLATSTTRNYRLVLRGDERAVRKEHPIEQRIFVQPYGDTHHDLEGFLRSLVRSPTGTPTTPVPPVPITPVPPPPATPVPPVPTTPGPFPHVVSTATPPIPASTSPISTAPVSPPRPVSRAHLVPLLEANKRRRQRELIVPGLALVVLCVAFLLGLHYLPATVTILLFLVFTFVPLLVAVSLWNKLDEAKMILGWLSRLPPHEIHDIPDSTLLQAALSLIKGSR